MRVGALPWLLHHVLWRLYLQYYTRADLLDLTQRLPLFRADV